MRKIMQLLRKSNSGDFYSVCKRGQRKNIQWHALQYPSWTSQKIRFLLPFAALWRPGAPFVLYIQCFGLAYAITHCPAPSFAKSWALFLSTVLLSPARCARSTSPVTSEVNANITDFGGVTRVPVGSETTLTCGRHLVNKPVDHFDHAHPPELCHLCRASRILR